MTAEQVVSIHDELKAAAPALSMETYSLQGEVLGLDLGAELNHPEGIKELCKVAFSLAREKGFSVFDPQLGRVVTEADAETIEARFTESGSYLEAAVVGSAANPAQLPSSSTARLWLLAGGGVILLLVLSKILRCGI